MGPIRNPDIPVDFTLLDSAAELIFGNRPDRARRLFRRRNVAAHDEILDLLLFNGIIRRSIDVVQCILTQWDFSMTWALRDDVMQLIYAALVPRDMRRLLNPTEDTASFQQWLKKRQRANSPRSDYRITETIILLIHRYKSTESAQRVIDFLNRHQVLDLKTDMWRVLTEESFESKPCAIFAVEHGALDDVDNWTEIDGTNAASEISYEFQMRRLAEELNSIFLDPQLSRTAQLQAASALFQHPRPDEPDAPEERSRAIVNAGLYALNKTNNLTVESLSYFMAQARFRNRIATSQNPAVCVVQPTEQIVRFLKTSLAELNVQVGFEIVIIPAVMRLGEHISYDWTRFYSYEGHGLWSETRGDDDDDNNDFGELVPHYPMNDAEYERGQQEVHQMLIYKNFIGSFINMFSEEQPDTWQPSAEEERKVRALRALLIRGREFFQFDQPRDLRVIEHGTNKELAQWIQEQGQKTRTVCNGDTKDPIFLGDLKNTPFMFITYLDVGNNVKQCYDIIDLRTYIVESRGLRMTNPTTGETLADADIQRVNAHFQYVFDLFITN